MAFLDALYQRQEAGIRRLDRALAGQDDVHLRQQEVIKRLDTLLAKLAVLGEDVKILDTLPPDAAAR